MPLPELVWYSYAVIRLVPRVERGECVNVGVLLFARTLRFLEARVEADAARVRALWPGIDEELLQRHLASFVAISAGLPAGGPIAALPLSERFHWLTAPRSAIIQTSPVHIGRCSEPRAALDELLDTFVRLPAL